MTSTTHLDQRIIVRPDRGPDLRTAAPPPTAPSVIQALQRAKLTFADAVDPAAASAAPVHLAPATANARQPVAVRRFLGSNLGADTAVAAAVLASVGALAGVSYHLCEVGTQVTLQSASDTLHYVWQTMTTVGFGDVPPKTPEGRLANAFFGTLGIVALTAKIGWAISAASHIRQLKTTGQFRSWFSAFGPARNARPIVILGGPQDEAKALPLYRRVIDDLRTNTALAKQPVVIVTQAFDGDLPEGLQQRGVIFIRGSAVRGKELRAAGIEKASAVIVLNDEATGDAGTLRTVAAARALAPDPKLPILAEMVRDRATGQQSSHEPLFAMHGAQALPCMRAISVFGGELLAPGSVDLFFRLASPYGERIEVCATADMLEGKTWRDVSRQVAGVGVPVAYRDSAGRLRRPEDVDAPLADVAHLYMMMPNGLPKLDTAAVAAALGAKAPLVQDPFATRPDQPLVLLNAPNAPEHLNELITDLRRVPGHEGRPVLIVSDQFPNGLPTNLPPDVKLETAGPEDEHAFRSLELHDAAAVLLMARDHEDQTSDSFTYMSTLKLLQQCGAERRMPRVLAEVVRFDSDARADMRTMLANLGVEVMPAARGEPLAPSALNARGSVDVLQRYIAPNQGLMRVVSVPAGHTWRELVASLAHLGTPLQWTDPTGAYTGVPVDVDAPVGEGQLTLLAHKPEAEVKDTEIAAALRR